MERRLWRTFIAAILTYSFTILFNWMSPHALVQYKNLKPTPEDGALGSYPWRTITAFPPTSHEVASHASPEVLCRSFPKERLLEIQPVLKTGHGVINRVHHSLRSTSACLDNLLIFSDFAETVDGHAVLDILADIPDRLLNGTTQTLPYRELLVNNRTLNNSNSATLMSGDEGWKIDKFKFLPSISRAWQMAPEKQWYVFFEGDTYILWDTVFRLLANYNPETPLYFGSPSPGREGTWFANGGPGYILSRGAMRRLVVDDWDKETGVWLGSQLVEKYWKEVLGDCCGDSVLGWVLHERGVELKGLWPVFNPHPLHGVPFSELYWCQPVLSLHKSFAEDFLKFWRWEWGHIGTDDRPILYRDLALSYFDFAHMVPRKDDWDNAAWDGYPPDPNDPFQPHTSVDTCSTACEKADGCFQWTYHLRRCWFVRSFRFGRAKQPFVEREHEKEGEEWTAEQQRYIAGWDTVKINAWIEERPCAEVQWVKPSTDRIF